MSRCRLTLEGAMWVAALAGVIVGMGVASIGWVTWQVSPLGVARTLLYLRPNHSRQEIHLDQDQEETQAHPIHNALQ